jgi:DNA repair protein RadD
MPELQTPAMNLRPYQFAAVESVYSYFGTKAGNPIVAMPTATGKSVVIAEFCKQALTAYPDQRILVATHQKELIEQNHQKLVDHWPQAPAGIFSASVGRREVAPITFVGIQTVAKKAALFGHVDLMLIDECHLVGASQNTQYLLFIDALKAANPNIKVVGFTATPYRLGMGMLTEGGIFTDICFDLTERLTFNRLIAEGYLCPLIARKTSVELDVTEVEKQGGEFVQKQLQDAVDRSPITSAALKEAIAAGGDRKHWLIFAAGLEHAGHISEMLNLMGVPCAVVSGDLPKSERERLLLDFRLGKYRAVVNKTS